MGLVGGSTNLLLLRVLVLVVLSVASTVVLGLGLGVVAGALAVSRGRLTAPCRSSTCGGAVPSRSSAIAAVRTLRRAEPTLRVGRNCTLPHLRTSPRGNVRASSCDVVSGRPCPRKSPTVSTRALPSFTELGHKAGILGVEATLHHTTVVRRRSVRVPVDSTVAGHVTGAAADATDDVRCEVTLLWTIVLPMTNTTAVLANLVFVVAKSTVESGEFAKLVALVVVLAFRSRGGLENIHQN
ncbi:hypothetical protein FKP32DRAFT_1365528 [Trametes sanguinea]|nr:hypothetical protein FKP32DRAFT_1365528 [Trametes sanguinea]